LVIIQYLDLDQDMDGFLSRDEIIKMENLPPPPPSLRKIQASQIPEVQPFVQVHLTPIVVDRIFELVLTFDGKLVHKC